VGADFTNAMVIAIKLVLEVVGREELREMQ
jgi:hypothetical protein